MYSLWQPLQYQADPPDFGSTGNLFKMIESNEHLKGFGGPEWHHRSIQLSEAHRDVATLYYRCPRQCGDALFGTARFAGRIAYSPELIYKLDNEARVYENMYNTNDWDRIQVSANHAGQ
jgi:hypothetical protein